MPTVCWKPAPLLLSPRSYFEGGWDGVDFVFSIWSPSKATLSFQRWAGGFQTPPFPASLKSTLPGLPWSAGPLELQTSGLNSVHANIFACLSDPVFPTFPFAQAGTVFPFLQAPPFLCHLWSSPLQGCIQQRCGAGWEEGTAPLQSVCPGIFENLAMGGFSARKLNLMGCIGLQNKWNHSLPQP